MDSEPSSKRTRTMIAGEDMEPNFLNSSNINEEVTNEDLIKGVEEEEEDKEQDGKAGLVASMVFSQIEQPLFIDQEANTTSESHDNIPVVTRRKDVLIWDDYFMSIAFLSSQRSKDPNTQVGACIVNQYNHIVGIGYNGFPAGCSDDILPWAREATNALDTKYMYVCHAEVNAILNKNAMDIRGCRMYVGLFPCNDCAKLIIQSGIKEVVYVSDKYRETNIMIASRRMLNLANITLRQYTPTKGKIIIDFGSVDR